MSDIYKRGRVWRSISWLQRKIDQCNWISKERKIRKQVIQERIDEAKGKCSRFRKRSAGHKNLRDQLEDVRRVEETLEYQNKCLEANITSQKEEEKRRENILMDHLKERTNDLNQLEEEFGQEERRIEEEIITLKIQLEEAKSVGLLRGGVNQ